MSHTISHARNNIDNSFGIIMFIIMVSFSILSLAYLSHMNSIATKGYAIKNFHKDQLELMSENDIWKQKLVELQSLNRLNKSNHIITMTDLKEVQFINTHQGLALKK